MELLTNPEAYPLLRGVCLWGAGGDVYRGTPGPGYRGLQVITDYAHYDLVDYLRAQGHGVTTWEGNGREGSKLIINIFLKRNLASQVEEEIKERDEDAFIVFMEPKHFRGGTMRMKK